MFSIAIKLSNFKSRLKVFTALLSLSTALIAAQPATATIVQFQTVMGDFSVNLYDKTTPKTVENFLAYVNAGAYTNSVIHRGVPGFVVQGGGYKYTGKLPLENVTQNAAVINEPVYSNKRGTIAMAKLDNQVNSATNQWFFNLADNAGENKLDAKNGGYTVFGEVTGNGMAIIDAMAALHKDAVNKEEFLLRNYTDADAANKVPITDKNLVLVLGIVVLDGSPDTAANLNPAKNTTINEVPQNVGSGGGGGAIGWMSIFALLGIAIMGRSRR